MDIDKKLTLRDMKGDLSIYFNWSANALMPVDPGAADVYLKQNRSTIVQVAQRLLKQMNYVPGQIYRGVILKKPVCSIDPHNNIQYLSFSTERSVAVYFADIKGFGSQIINFETRLGKHGYVIEYTPKLSEILFHHHLLSILPYNEAFTMLGMYGSIEVEGLKRQKEVMILQPDEPFMRITKIKNRQIQFTEWLL